MNIVVFGASGTIGRAITEEALARKHEVTVAARDASRLDFGAKVHAVVADATKADDVARASEGKDVIVSAIGPTKNSPPTLLADAARALCDGARRTKAKRLVAVGGAGSLYVAPGVELVDGPGFRPEWKPVALAHRDALLFYRTVNDVPWTYISPAALIEPGHRTGKYRVGGDDLLKDASGKSHISVADFAIGVLDEIEKGHALRKRITFAY